MVFFGGTRRDGAMPRTRNWRGAGGMGAPLPQRWCFCTLLLRKCQLAGASKGENQTGGVAVCSCCCRVPAGGGPGPFISLWERRTLTVRAFWLQNHGFLQEGLAARQAISAALRSLGVKIKSIRCKKNQQVSGWPLRSQYLFSKHTGLGSLEVCDFSWGFGGLGL